MFTPCLSVSCAADSISQGDTQAMLWKEVFFYSSGTGSLYASRKGRALTGKDAAVSCRGIPSFFPA